MIKLLLKYFLYGICLVAVICLSPAYVRCNTSAKIKDIRLGSYSEYSRIVFDLDRDVNYEVIPERKMGIVKILLKNTVVDNYEIQKKKFTDARLKSISLKRYEDGAEVIINYRYPKDAFFYFSLKDPPRIIIDVKKRDEIIELADKKENLEKDAAADGFVKIYSSKKEYAEEDDNERNIYKDAIRLFQKHHYKEAISMLEDIRIKFPEGRYGETAKFLIADAYYNIARVSGKSEDHLIAIEAYKDAIREYPDSEKSAYAQYKVGKTYLDINFFVEAKASFDTALSDYPKSNYEQAARFGIMRVYLEDKNFTQSYNEFTRGAAIKPESNASRDATLLLANVFFEHNDYIISQRLYENGMVRWPDYIKTHPDILFRIGVSFLENEHLDKAKEALFDLVNLHSDSEFAEEAFLKIGDYYRKIGDDKDSLKMYIEALARRPESELAGLSELRMANIGIESPDIQSKMEVFNYDAYLEPIAAYQKIAEKFYDKPIAEEALFRKSISLFNGNKYIEAILSLKKMISNYPGSPFAEKGVSYLRDIFLKLIDSYYSQEGYFPILLTYHKNANPFLRNITESRILYKIGESYQKLGIYDIAENNYNKLRKLDKDRHYKKKIMLRMAEIRLAKGEYSKAEDLLISFFTGPRPVNSDYLAGIRLYAYTLYKQKKFKGSSREYLNILKRFPDISDVSEIYYYLGKSFYGIERYSNAADAFDKAVKLYKPDKKDGLPFYILESYYYKGDSMYQAAQYRSAIPALKTALKKYPDDEWLMYLMGKSYEKIKDNRQAKDVLTKLASAKTGLLASAAETDLRNMEWYDKNMEDLKVK